MNRTRTLALAAVCTTIGAGGALGTDAIGSFARGDSHRGAFAAHGGAALLHAVHAEAVVPKRDGTFATVVLDRGVVKAVDGRDLTITEGTRTHTYKDVTLTIPSDAKIRVAGKPDATLADVAVGMRAVVAQLPARTLVIAAPPRESRR
jgi:hypothetical protein